MGFENSLHFKNDSKRIGLSVLLTWTIVTKARISMTSLYYRQLSPSLTNLGNSANKRALE